jgi:hypothetical protein
MTDGGPKPRPATEARDMLAIFASVGARQFDLTVTDINSSKVFFKRAQPFAELSRDMPAILEGAASRQRNVNIRPYAANLYFVQLDDLGPDMLARLAPAVFLTINTSPGSYQAWAAIPGDQDKDFAGRLRKGTGADATASGATRIAGSFNFKPKYAPDFPRVRIEAGQPGRTTTVAELDQLGLVAPPQKEAYRPPARSGFRVSDPHRWPDYARCLEGAPPNASERVSVADFTWCMIALDWGFSPDATAARLMEQSTKAKENGERYATRTVEAAAAAVARRGPPRGRTFAPQVK